MRQMCSNIFTRCTCQRSHADNVTNTEQIEVQSRPKETQEVLPATVGDNAASSVEVITTQPSPTGGDNLDGQFVEIDISKGASMESLRYTDTAEIIYKRFK